MRDRQIRVVAGVFLLAANIKTMIPAAYGAEPVEKWTPVSKMAGVTGGITFSPDRITFQDKQFLPLESVGELSFVDSVTGKQAKARVFKVQKPADPLEMGVPLCGAPITFITLWSRVQRSARDRTIALYSGLTPPTGENGICASFSYDAARSPR